MMTKEELILAIRACEAIARLDRMITGITGDRGISGSSFDDIFCVTDLIYRQYDFYDPDSDEAYDDFAKILYAEDLSAEEKYDKLVMGMKEEEKKSILEEGINLLHYSFNSNQVFKFIAAVSTDPGLAGRTEVSMSVLGSGFPKNAQSFKEEDKGVERRDS